MKRNKITDLRSELSQDFRLLPLGEPQYQRRFLYVGDVSVTHVP